jgi:hypothetical protein
MVRFPRLEKGKSFMLSKIIRDIRILGFTVAERSETHGDFFTVIAWCFECRAWHAHTGFKVEPQPGVQLHRYPHCDNANYRKLNLYDGYVVEIVGPATTEVLADHQRQHPRGLKATGWHEGENPVADQAA